jgi:hypothetical protein
VVGCKQCSYSPVDALGASWCASVTLDQLLLLLLPVPKYLNLLQLLLLLLLLWCLYPLQL